MKKQLLLVLGCSLLGACVAHETDLYAAQERRDAALVQKRAQMGCTFIRDHDAYRQCILNTYYLQQPQGYETRELTTGQPIAVISNPATGCGGSMGCGNKVAPLPSSGPQVIPYSTTESQTVETTCTQNYEAREASVTTTEVLPAPAPVQIVTQAVQAPVPAAPVPVVVPPPVVVATPAPVAAPAPAPEVVPVAEPEPAPTLYDSYLAQKLPEPIPLQPVCPCPDPNDPCPQCFDK